MKNKILGWIGVVWGGLLLISGIVRVLSGEMSQGAYGAGQLVGFLLAGGLLLGGVFALRKKQ